MSTELPPDLAAAVALGGEMGGRFASFDWSAHPLGPPAGWSPGIRTTVAMALTSRFPTVLWLGSELFLVYNDAYIPVLGEKHPAALGGAGHEVWAEIWDPIGPMLEGVVTSGIATWSSDLMLPVVTSGRPQERYFTFTYSPMLDARGVVEGVFCAVTETTERVLSERRLEALNALASALIDASSVQAAVHAATEVFATRTADVPFLAAYLGDSTSGGDFPLAAASSTVMPALEAEAPTLSSWEVPAQHRDLVEGVANRFPAIHSALADGCPERALVLPVGDFKQELPAGALVVGLNPLRPLDDSYVGFCRLLTDQVTGALASIAAYEHERQRAEVLEQLDQAKTAFLTNVSHEFRTPLTLMLGPIEDAINQASGDQDTKERLEMVRRNGLRLLRMVNSLLDFAQLEAGRAAPRMELTDVGSLTAEVSSSFAELCAQAGLDLVVNCAPVVAQIDTEMWETIILNLLSNAFKFTLAGSISVEVAAADSGGTSVMVSDTGVGIAAQDLDRIFERFYRPSNTGGRSVEGSGIGLALVKSLIEVQGGTIGIDSRPGGGTKVIINLPPVESEVPTRPRTSPGQTRAENAFALEARGWLDDRAAAGPDHTEEARPVVLVVDDNRDMRRQLERILTPRFRVRSVANGNVALEEIRRELPDLVVTDVMMPAGDGFTLIAAIRSEPATADLPVIVLSARAGVEAAGEGMQAGADDYIVKPFRSADLLNRVEARLKATARSRSREASEEGSRRAASLADLGRALSAAASSDEVLQSVLACPLVTPPPAGISIGIADEREQLIQVRNVGSLNRLLADRYHTVGLNAPVPMAEVVRTGETLAVSNPMDLDDRYDAALRDPAAGLGASITVALRADGGTVLGALSLSWRETRHFDDEEIRSYEEAASLVSSAVERLKTAEAEHRVASQLQDRLLQLNVRSTAGAVGALYQPASEELRVGGDWYTAISLDDDRRLAVSVGDVAGHGITAAAAMSQLRAALNAAALTTSEPSVVVDVIERYAGIVQGAACTTLAYAVLDKESETISYTCAGHPYPLLIRPDGTVVYLQDGRRPPIDTSWSTPGSESGHASAPAGSVLLLYTDGLIERRGESLEAGMNRLASVAEKLAFRSVGEICADVVAELEPPGGHSDDVAVVALRPTGETRDCFVDMVPARVNEVPSLRRKLRRWLRSQALDEALTHDVLVAVGEAFNNAIEHGSDFDPNKRVAVEVFAEDGMLSASVSDSGRWDADSAASGRGAHRGRGLALIYGLADDVSMVRSGLGTRVTMRYFMPTDQVAS